MVRREIGSEFWDVPITHESDRIFPECVQWFLSGRNALQAIVTELGEARNISLPSWCCDSMIKPFVDAHYTIYFYPVFVEKRNLFQMINLDCDVLFLMDYFGYTGQQPDISSYRGTVIRDVTHSIFSSSYSDADYYFGSLRKWCGIWTGGYAWTKNGHRLRMEQSDDLGYVCLREKAMILKNSYLHGYSDKDGKQVTDKGYLEVFEEAEDVLERVGIAPAAERDVQLAKRIDTEFIRSRRRVNAEILRKAFRDWLFFPEMKNTDSPMFVPVIVPDGKRDALRRYLIQNEIYCPVHWPVSEYHKVDERSKYLYDNELSLVCDQRYAEDDMKRIVNTIKMFMED